MEEIYTCVEEYLTTVCKSVGKFEEEGEVTQEEINNKLKEVAKKAFGISMNEGDSVDIYLCKLYNGLSTNFFIGEEGKTFTRQDIKKKTRELVEGTKRSMEMVYG